ncbi:MAG: response regulator, partial [Microcella sp.]|nr:response regulator [Microcella sp.]
EAAIRQIVTRTLTAHGYTTCEAENGREGIELLESLDPRVDLVLTDMQMPIMDGAATIAYLAQHHPDVIVIAASGFTANGSETVSHQVSSIPIIAKPFTTETLLTAISTALSAKRADC